MSDAPPVRAEVRYAAEVPASGGGRVPIRRLAEEAQLSERSLERQFLRWVGVSPKHFSRLTGTTPASFFRNPDSLSALYVR
ncbi:hypothetical protein [Cohnella zeiphila]|uniref:HTH araC/xylS-type domain-containing protein n=1 Tax=Cohnella zeiphila TaxID=2761120 RepID=A0A7X0SQE2_9BACL|nr:hypothetical protein [Cohnella zeiphila]MBB6734218.1 hypothetical protein [Cohnella zeiphila]